MVYYYDNAIVEDLRAIFSDNNIFITPADMMFKTIGRVNQDNIELENDFLEYLSSTDKSPGTIKQYKANLHIF